jgi:hypothetical protein
MKPIRVRRSGGTERVMSRRAIAAVFACVLTLAAGAAAYGRGGGDPMANDQTLKMLHVEAGYKFLDVGRPWKGDLDPSPGDTVFLRYKLRNPANTETLGKVMTKCVATFRMNFKCAGTVFLEDGTIELVSMIDWAADYPFTKTVAGGTGRYRNAGGEAWILAPDADGNETIVLHLSALD